MIGRRGLGAGRDHIFGQGFEDRAVDRGVEVAADDGRGFLAGDLVDLFDEQLHALFARRLALVVEVGVEIEELLARLPVLEFDPRHRAVAGPVPAARHLVGRFAEPERAAVEQLETVAQVVDGHELALLGAVVAAHAHAGVLRALGVDVVQLVDKSFLHAEHVGSLPADHLRSGVTTFHPDVVAVLAVAVTQVVGDQFDRFGAVGGECRH